MIHLFSENAPDKGHSVKLWTFCFWSQRTAYHILRGYLRCHASSIMSSAPGWPDWNRCYIASIRVGGKMLCDRARKIYIKSFYMEVWWINTKLSNVQYISRNKDKVRIYFVMSPDNFVYHKAFNIRRTLGKEIVNHSDVAGASPVSI